MECSFKKGFEIEMNNKYFAMHRKVLLFWVMLFLLSGCGKRTDYEETKYIDFYEAYAQDAVDVSNILSITLTYKLEGFEEGDRIAHAGFPFRDLDRYLPRLVRAGKRIAICDQIE